MANARIVIGTTGGQMELSESTGVTGATGYGTIYTSSVDNKPHFVDTNGNDSVIALGAAGALQLDSAINLTTPGATASVFAGKVCSVVIGQIAQACQDTSVSIGFCSVVTADGFGGGIAIGRQSISSGFGGVSIGTQAKNSGGTSVGLCSISCGGGDTVAMGYQSLACTGSFASGFQVKACGCSIGIGYKACTTTSHGGALGTNACSTHTGSFAIGCAVTSERTNTTHVNNLLAYGQGVSKGHNIGSTGGTVTVDWDNSNTQKISLSSNITSLTLSNPIQGGVYSLIVEQTTSGGNTITWPAGAIKWPGGTPPTLTSGATGDTDVISLIYDPAGGTGYLGNANLAFS